MNEVDYIIVGCGLAGIAFCETLKANSKSYIVFDNASQQSSVVAAGLYNPVILKRFSEVWQAKEQLEKSLPVYEKIEDELEIDIDYKLRLLRRFTSIEEQNNWFSASDKPNLQPYMSLKLLKNSNANINAEYGFGEVLQAGRLDTPKLIERYKQSLKNENLLCQNTFEYGDVNHQESHVIYSNFKAKHIIFAEGFGVKQNPFFDYLPLNGTKGEVLTLHIPDLNIDYIVKSSVFVIPVGNDLYKVGSTYNWNDKTNTPTASAKEELLTKLKTFIKADFEVVDHTAGIRPTVKDRRPLVGQHSKFKNLYVLNGLGTRGVMIAPYVAEKLFEYIEHQIPLDEEIDCNRFDCLR